MATIITSAGNVTTKRTRGGYLLLNDGGEPIGEWTPDGLMLGDGFSGAASEVASACSKLWSPQPKTIRVRIAVAVGDLGPSDRVCLMLYGHEREEDLRSELAALLADVRCDEGYGVGPYAVHFIEATVPLPESVTVEGEVVK